MHKTLAFVVLLTTVTPSVLSQPVTKSSASEQLFDEFWTLLNDHYAFFDLRKVNWKKQYEVYRPKVTAGTSEEELFRICYEMINPLKDGHTFIIYNGKKYRSGGDQAIWKDAGPTRTLIQKKYLTAELKQQAGGVIKYGWIENGIGYVSISAMEGYSPSEIDPVIKEFANARSIIVDARFNGGGMDETSLRMVDRFADQRRFVYSKETHYKGKLGEHRDLYVEPHGNPVFKGKLFLLTNGATFSAAEMFVMAMTALPNCTVIGENSAGAHSDVLEKSLSNGWRIGMSHQIYTMPDGKVYEMTGIPPDIYIKADLQSGKDLILEKAISLSK